MQVLQDKENDNKNSIPIELKDTLKAVAIARELFDMLLPAYTEKGSSNWRWSKMNPELGYCGTTAMVLQETLKQKLGEGASGFIVDGIMVSSPTPLRYGLSPTITVSEHIINKLRDGTIIDLTKGQFRHVEKVELLHHLTDGEQSEEMRRILMAKEPQLNEYDYKASHPFRNKDIRDRKTVDSMHPGKNLYEDLMHNLLRVQRENEEIEHRRFVNRIFPSIETYVCNLLGAKNAADIEKRVSPAETNKRIYIFSYTKRA